LVSGVLALAKQANPLIESRMAKHLFAKTSIRLWPEDTEDREGWYTNAAGVAFANKYGFGIVDADAFSLAATQYAGVTPLETLVIETTSVNEVVNIGDSVGVTRSFSIDVSSQLEEVEIHLNVTGRNRGDIYFSRGNVEAMLESPSGTKSLLLYRNASDYWDGAIDWTFASNAFWGENPFGDWKLTLSHVDVVGVNDDGGALWQSFSATLRMGTLIPSGLPGDTDADGDIDLNDLNNVRNNFGGEGSPGETVGDAFPYDGVVNLEDLNAVRNNFGEGAASSVPEPTGMAIAAVCVLVAMASRSLRSRMISR